MLLAIQKVINAARADLGMGEYPPNSNRNPIVTWYNEMVDRIGAGPWCAMALTHWMYEGEAKSIITGHALVDAFVRDGVSGHKGASWHWGIAGIRPGDFPVFDWSLPDHPGTRSLTEGDHIGLCEKVASTTTFYSLEGNYGDACVRVLRDRKYILGYVRPDWSQLGGAVMPSPRPPAVRRIPGTSLPLLDVDGELGAKTKKAAMVIAKTASWSAFLIWLQKRLNLGRYRDEDGRALRVDGKGIDSNESGRYPRRGTTHTLYAAQRWLGTERDGYLSSPTSEWVRRFQRKLNTGKLF